MLTMNLAQVLLGTPSLFCVQIDLDRRPNVWEFVVVHLPIKGLRILENGEDLAIEIGKYRKLTDKPQVVIVHGEDSLCQECWEVMEALRERLHIMGIIIDNDWKRR